MPVRQKDRDNVPDETNTEETTTEEAKAEIKKSTKTPVPDGYQAPVEFAKTLDVPPQIVYGYIKNMKGFPFIERGESEKPRFLVKIPEATEFLKVKATEKAEKAAAKEAKKAAEAEKANEPANA